MTEAVPIIIPRPVSSDLTGFCRRAWRLKPRASPKCIGLAALCLLQQLLGFLARRIVRRESRRSKILLEQGAGRVEVAIGFDQGLGAGVDNRWFFGREFLGFE